MALKINYKNNNNGISFSGAYMKITYINCSYVCNDKYNVIIFYDIYVNESSKNEGKDAIEEGKKIELYIDKKDFENKSIFKCCYDEIKKIDKYNDAENI